MKIQKLPVTLLFLILSGAVTAQKFTWGIKTASTLSINSFPDQLDKEEFTHENKIGFQAAGLLNVPLKNNFSIQHELGFSQRGRKVQFNNDSSLNNASYKFLDFTFLARKSFPVQWGTHIPGNWFLNVGPRISYWLSGSGKVTGNHPFDYEVEFGPLGEVPIIEQDKMYLQKTNRWLFAIDVGIGIDAPVLKTHDIIVEVRYSYGFIPYGTKNSAYNSTPGFRDSLKATEQVLSVSIGYTFTHDLKEKKKGKSTKQDRKKLKPRKEIDSMLN